MKKQITYRNLIIAAALMIVAGLAHAFAQTSKGTQINNTAVAYVMHPNGQADTVKSNTVSTPLEIPGKLTLSKTTLSTNVIVGNIVSYRLIIGNAGYSTLSKVHVVDSLSANLQFVNATQGTFANGVLSWSIDSLTANISDTVAVTALVLPSVANNTFIWNKAIATELSGQKAIDSIRVVAQSLSVSKNAPASAFTKDTIAYVIQIADSSSSSLLNAVLIDTINSGMTFINATNGGVYDAAARRVIWNIGKLDSLLQAQYKITGVINDTTISSYTLFNQAWLSASGINPINAKAQTQVQRSNPVLFLTKKASQDTVTLGKVFTYTIVANNAGNVRLTGVKVLDTLHTAFLIPLRAANAVLTDSVVSWSKDTMAVGEADTIAVLVQLRVDAPNAQLIPNTVYANSHQSASTIFKAQANIVAALALSGQTTNPAISIRKTASSNIVITGDSVTYTISIQNTGNVTLHHITVRDTLNTLLSLVRHSSNAVDTGKVVTYKIDSLNAGVMDSIKIVVQMASDAANHTPVKNIAFVQTDEITTGKADTSCIAAKVVVSNKSCRIYANVNPKYVIGNGVNASKLLALVTDTLNHPKPKGTPITFKTSAGIFSNGLDSIVVSADINGVALDSLRALITSNTIVRAKVTISASDSDVCYVSDTVCVVFYPGAITGIVIDNQTSRPDSGAHVQVLTSSGVVVDSAVTSNDGVYLIPVPSTDSYRVRISVVDKFGKTIVTTTTVPVAVPGTGGNPPVPNKNYISGKVYFIAMDKPIEAYKVKLNLHKISAGSSGVQKQSAANDTSIIGFATTDSTGTYTFGVSDSAAITTGSYAIATCDSTVQGSVLVSNNSQGRYIINANIAIVLNPSIKLTKTGPSARSAGDTATYFINLNNLGNLSATSAQLADSLDKAMRFVSAWSASGITPSYDSVKNIVTWPIGTLDSLNGTNHQFAPWVTVRFADTISTTTTLTNNVSFTCLQDTSAVRSFASTNVSASEILITKTASKSIVEVGDVLAYTITVTNKTATVALHTIQVYDRIPLGFKYIGGSTFIDGRKAVDPATGKYIVWTVDTSLAPGATSTLVYRLVAGAGAMVSNGINTAYATGKTPGNLNVRSADASVQVAVKQGIFTDHGVIVGKVFYDRNRNAYQDDGEEGVKGVELVMEDGTRITTGDDGKYSLPDVWPGEHVIRVRKYTIPKGSVLAAGYGQFAGDPVSRFVTVTPSGIARADFYLVTEGPDTLTLKQSMAKIGNISLQRIAEPRNIVFIEDEKLAPMKLSGLTFDVAKATLRDEAMPTLKQLSEILTEYPDISVTIVGHTDSSPMHTKEFTDNTALSIARANAVKTYLAQKEHIDSSRVKACGYGETKPIASNKTKEGKALNRRVEFYFDSRMEQPQRTTTSIVFKIPINYEGSASITKIEMTDSLDNRMAFEEGSATLGDTLIVPQVEGTVLHWTINNVGTNFHKILVYRATIHKPAEKIVTLTSQTTAFKYYIHDTVVTSDAKLMTNNQAAVAVRGRAVNYILSGVLFDVAKSTLRQSALTALITSAEALKQDPTATVVVEGHTDAIPIHTADFSSNVELSEARAKTVVEKLTSNFGIAESRMRYIGFGEYRPLTTNATAEGKQLNRRVEVRIVSKSFIESVIPDGFIDSSVVEHEQFAPSQKDFGTSEFGHVGDQLVYRLAVQRNANTQSLETMIIDSLPHGLRIVKNSMKTEQGIDSVVDGNIITAKLSVSALNASMSFVTEIVTPVDMQDVMSHQFSVIRHEKNGDVLIDRVTPMLLQVVKNNK